MYLETWVKVLESCHFPVDIWYDEYFGQPWNGECSTKISFGLETGRKPLTSGNWLVGPVKRKGLDKGTALASCLTNNGPIADPALAISTLDVIDLCM